MLTDERINELAWIARDAGPDVMLLLKTNIRQAAFEAARDEREACAEIISGAAAGFCGGRAEIVMRTVANSIRERSNV